MPDHRFPSRAAVKCSTNDEHCFPIIGLRFTLYVLRATFYASRHGSPVTSAHQSPKRTVRIAS
jgi:hypothetical protein